ncbi:MAG: D-cysteine desulfhydrase family protein [Hyphomicrobiaceae bacterium]|nr:D-cysteine desulfhydrase family protein [Hyphomicrobiaceae bacterium]
MDAQIEIRQRPVGRLDDLSRTSLMSGETPLEEMRNMAARLGPARLFVKRDDLTGLAFGGNKVRQLEFYIGEAEAKGADTILITGAVQSNFVRLAAASARMKGMDCHIQLEERVPKNDPIYRNSGNVLIDKILGATLHTYPDGEDEAGADANLGEMARGLKAQGKRPYVIHLSPGHAPLGALGYVDAARELLAQCAAAGIELTEVVLASGSGHTHGGMLFGLRALGHDALVTGVCVRRDVSQQVGRISRRCEEIAELLEMENPVNSERDVVLTDAFLAPGYGQLNDDVIAAMKLAAETEGLITDPVYTAKAVCGLIERAKQAEDGNAIVFIHTGGTPAIFGYERDLGAALDAAS